MRAFANSTGRVVLIVTSPGPKVLARYVVVRTARSTTSGRLIGQVMRVSWAAPGQEARQIWSSTPGGDARAPGAGSSCCLVL